jgi:hypothetical protein
VRADSPDRSSLSLSTALQWIKHLTAMSVYRFVLGLLVFLASWASCRTPSEPTEPTESDSTTEEGSPSPSSESQLLEDLTSYGIYAPGNWWSRDISNAPVDPDSDAIIRFIGGDSLHPDFGPPPFGIPYVTVSSGTPLVPVTFVDFPEESDDGAPGRPGYPIPEEAKSAPNYIEGAVPGGGGDGDRHLLVLDRDRLLLFETWATRWNGSANRWEAGSGAVFDLSTNARRPEGWTSADAAGLAILPGLVRYDEVFGSDEIRHAFRVTVRATNGHVWPASHTAGDTPGAPPMGTRLRLRRGTDLSRLSAPLRRVFRAMQSYGLIVADNGSDMFITGTMDPRWNNDELNPAFRQLSADDFEVIELGWR